MIVILIITKTTEVVGNRNDNSKTVVITVVRKPIPDIPLSVANHACFYAFIRGECTSCWSLRADTAAASFVYTCTRTVRECTACEHHLQYADKC